MFFIYSERLNL